MFDSNMSELWKAHFLISCNGYRCAFQYGGPDFASAAGVEGHDVFV